MKPIYFHKRGCILFATSIFVTLLLLLSVCMSFAQQRTPFSEKTVVQKDGILLMPYTKGVVKKNITGNYKPIFDRICSIVTLWDSINPPQGMEINFFGYGKRLEIYFRNYLYVDGQKITEEGGPHLDISINDPLSIVGTSVVTGIYISPQKTDEFHGYPIYNIGKGGEVTIATNAKVPLYMPVSQEEYLKMLIKETKDEISKYPPLSAEDYQATLQEMERAYQVLLKTDQEAAKEIKQQMVEFKEEINQKNDNNQSLEDPVLLLKKKLSDMTEEEKKRDAYYGGEDVSGLVPYEQRQFGEALIKVNPALIQALTKGRTALVVLSWSISSDSATDGDKPRFYNKGNKGIYHVDYLMSKLYENQQIWNDIFSMLYSYGM